MNQNLKKYFKENLNNHSIEELKNKALEFNYSTEEVNEVYNIFNKEKKLFNIYFLPFILLVLIYTFLVLFFNLKIQNEIIISLILFICLIFPVIEAFKKDINKKTSIIYSIISLILIPISLSIYFRLLLFYNNYFEIARSFPVTSPESVIAFSIMFHFIIFYSIITSIFIFNFLSKNLFKNKSKIYSILISISFLFFIFIFSKFIFTFSNNLIIDLIEKLFF